MDATSPKFLLRKNGASMNRLACVSFALVLQFASADAVLAQRRQVVYVQPQGVVGLQTVGGQTTVVTPFSTVATPYVVSGPMLYSLNGTAIQTATAQNAGAQANPQSVTLDQVRSILDLIRGVSGSNPANCPSGSNPAPVASPAGPGGGGLAGNPLFGPTGQAPGGAQPAGGAVAAQPGSDLSNAETNVQKLMVMFPALSSKHSELLKARRDLAAGEMSLSEAQRQLAASPGHTGWQNEVSTRSSRVAQLKADLEGAQTALIEQTKADPAVAKPASELEQQIKTLTGNVSGLREDIQKLTAKLKP